MADARIRRQPLFELLDLRTENELSVRQHGVHSPADVPLQPRALALQVEERDARSRRDRKGGSG
jgi:hypothetical protein